MAGKGIYAKHPGVKPGDGKALSAAVAASAARTSAQMAVRDVQRSPSMGASAAAHFQKGADARAASAAAAELAAKPAQAPSGPSTEALLFRSNNAAKVAKERHRVAESRASMAEMELKSHLQYLERDRTKAADENASPFDRRMAATALARHEGQIPKAQEAHAAAQAHLERAKADLKTANAAARLAKKTHDAAPKVETPKPEGPPTHTLTEAKAGARTHHREAGENLESARWAKNAQKYATDEAAGIPHAADKAAKLAEADKHGEEAKAHLAKAVEHAKKANAFDTMIKSGHVMTAENTTAKPGTAREDFAEHRAARADRLEERSGKAFAESRAHYSNVRRIGDNIPMGQPILVGHHSEKRARRDIARIDNGMRQSIAANKRGKELASRALSARANNAISSDDPHAISSLKTRIAELEHGSARAVEGNKILRAAKGDREVAHAALIKAGHSEQSANNAVKRDFGNNFRGFDTKSAGAERRRLAERLDGLVAARARGPAAEKTIHGVTIHEADNRVRLGFGGKPPDNVRSYLKSNGFKWAPSNGSWQRQSSPQAHHHAEIAAKMMPAQD